MYIMRVHAAIPLHHELQLGLGALDLVLSLHVQHVGRVFPIDLQDNVTRLKVCLLCLAAPIDLWNRRMSCSEMLAPGRALKIPLYGSYPSGK